MKLFLVIPFAFSINLLAQKNTFISTVKNDAQTLVKIVDSLYIYKWDTTYSSYQKDYKKIILHDVNNNATNFTELIWDGATWVNQSRSTMIFNNANMETSLLKETWDGNAWIKYDKVENVYDMSNNIQSKIYQKWISNSWVNHMLMTYTYDINNNKINVLYQMWINGVWVNNSKETNIYDMNNNNINQSSQIWVNSVWVNCYQETNTFDTNNNKLNTLTEYWYSSTYVKTHKLINTYDINNNNTLTQLFSWNTATSTWYLQYKNCYKYDSDNFINNETHLNYTNNSLYFTSLDSIQYYYHTKNANIINSHAINVFKVYPNPTNDHITIDNGNISNLTGYQIKITNSLSQQVFQSTITQQQFYVDLSTWTGNGIYFVHVIDAQGNTIDIKKIVLQ